MKGTSVDEREIIDNILDRVRILVSKNESEPVVNVDSLGRSIHYININKNILDRVRLVVDQNAFFSNINNFNSGRLEIVKLEIF